MIEVILYVLIKKDLFLLLIRMRTGYCVLMKGENLYTSSVKKDKVQEI